MNAFGKSWKLNFRCADRRYKLAAKAKHEAQHNNCEVLNSTEAEMSGKWKSEKFCERTNEAAAGNDILSCSSSSRIVATSDLSCFFRLLLGTRWERNLMACAFHTSSQRRRHRKDTTANENNKIQILRLLLAPAAEETNRTRMSTDATVSPYVGNVKSAERNGSRDRDEWNKRKSNADY